ncbi:tetratricopeptide repeat protein [Paraflavitalea speifideaquila]|uniref:tetratricopeptide repeat protein n=1 Tax=Paraflavitalea speifideaquila TaxID=3076558 RepID=UPI0028E7F903|nr:tetratricopeptide repeat protein [Paraflavitalea speifideiaquila]
MSLLLFVTAFPQSLQDVHNRYQPLIKGAKEDTTLVRNLLKYGNDLLDYNNDTAVIILQQTAIVSSKINDVYGMGKSAFLIGGVHQDKGEYGVARACYDTAVKYFSLLSSQLDLGKVFYNTGNLYYFQDQYDEAIGWYLKGAAAFEKAAAPGLLARAYDGIGNTLHSMDQYEKSLGYFKMAEGIARENKDSVMLTRILNNKSIAYHSMGKKKESLQMKLAALPFADSQHDLISQSTIRSNIADAYIDFRKMDSAAYYLREAERLALKSGRPYYLMQVFLCYSKMYKGTKDYRKARDYLLKSIKIAEELGSKEGLFKAYGNLLQVYSSLGMNEESMAAFQQFVLYNDSIANEGMLAQANELETKYRTVQKDKEIAEKQLAIEHQRSTLKKKIW